MRALPTVAKVRSRQRNAAQTIALCCALLTACTQTPWRRAAHPDARDATPNIVIFFVDDMGYADIAPFGGTTPTPHLEELAAAGMRFTDFSVSSAVCSASRASLITGCYHERVGVRGAFGPDARIGLADEEVTLAELCRSRGYATACFGKWHLGHLTPFLPQQHGFDEFYGLPYSNDMWPLHPNFAHLPADAAERKRGYPNLPLYEGNRICDPEVDAEDQAQLTAQYTARALDFIARHHSEPFFLYLPYSMVHVPLFASEAFLGRSGRGLYADVVQEIDDSVGQVMAALRKHGIEEDTLVIFSSDNGPWLSYGNHAGSAGILREGKGTMFEGGVRVPTIAQWKGRIPAGTVCDEFAATIDVLPTCARLIGAELPPLPIDGHDITPLLFGNKDALSPHLKYGGWYNGELRTVRNRRWKLHLPHSYASLNHRLGGLHGAPANYGTLRIELSLFDLKSDPGETKNLAAEQSAVVTELLVAAEALRADLGDKLNNPAGTGRRKPGSVDT